MNIFIETYHLVKKGIDLPSNLIAKYKQDKLLREQKIEQEERARRLLQETMGTVSSIEQAQVELENEKVNNENLFTFNYVVKDSSGKQIKGSFDAKTITEVEAFLANEGYEVVKVEPQKKNALTMDINLFGNKLSSGELSFVLTQISTYLKAGIPLVDAVRILTRQTEKPAKRKIYEKIVYDLVSGEKF